eukprot:2264821-Pleurochrysis_carterae.AAC.1
MISTPPVLGNEHSQRATFMMTSRSGKNKRGDSGFVKKWARLSALRTNGTVSSSSSTFFLIKKCLTAMDMLFSSVMLGVIREVDDRLVVEM